jgi:hypothetical protein
LYAREREAERQEQQAGTAASLAADSITLDKAIQAIQLRMKSGMATIPAGTTLHGLRRDANGVVVDYAGENVTLPRRKVCTPSMKEFRDLPRKQLAVIYGRLTK